MYRRPQKRVFSRSQQTLSGAMGFSSFTCDEEVNEEFDVSSIQEISLNSTKSKAAVRPYFYGSLPGVLQFKEDNEIYPDDSASNICQESSLPFKK